LKKADLILNLSEQSTLPKATVKTCVNSILSTLTDGIVEGERIEVRGFGSFYRKYKKAHLGINPKTSEKTQVEEKYTPFFKPGKLLKEVVNN